MDPVQNPGPGSKTPGNYNDLGFCISKKEDKKHLLNHFVFCTIFLIEGKKWSRNLAIWLIYSL